MKKRNIRTLDALVYFLFVLMTMVTLFIIYKDVPSRSALTFVTAYAILAILIPFYILIRVLFTVKQFTFEEVKKEGFKFVIFFICIMMLGLIGNFILPLPDLRLSKILPSSLAFAFGITCFDIAFSKRTK
ncbi:hypothetical protein [Clostridium sp. LIBA-8841]|uniref:hypothetical protein n=1 Tax=Clostridium sp. LIBA-8841 TaxID=2987530 RepID=UPI002AC48FAB|nr:hypothetical protein [Clostridium sp. LIBA-8841]MDZ5255224.1 hypothetical protein [Clostridium sp. LIBA-8841]